MATILLIADSKDLEELFITIFTMQGMEVVTAHDKEEALARFQQCDLALINVHVNNQDGREISRKIKSLSHIKSVPVILMSSNRHMLHDYPDWGAEDMLEMPFDIKDLVEVVQRNLKSSK